MRSQSDVIVTNCIKKKACKEKRDNMAQLSTRLERVITHCLRYKHFSDITCALFFLQSDNPISKDIAESIHRLMIHNYAAFSIFRGSLSTAYETYLNIYPTKEEGFLYHMIGKYLVDRPTLFASMKKSKNKHIIEICRHASEEDEPCAVTVGNLFIPPASLDTGYANRVQKYREKGSNKSGDLIYPTYPTNTEFKDPDAAFHVAKCLDILQRSCIGKKDICMLGGCTHYLPKCEVYRIVNFIYELHTEKHSLSCYTGQCDCGSCEGYGRILRGGDSQPCASGMCDHYMNKCQVRGALNHLFTLQKDVKCLFGQCDATTCEKECRLQTLHSLISESDITLQDLHKALTLEGGFCHVCFQYRSDLVVCFILRCQDCFISHQCNTLCDATKLSLKQ